MQIQTRSPRLEPQRVSQRPPSEEWQVGSRTFATTDELVRQSGQLPDGQEVTYRFRTTGGVDLLKTTAAAAATGAVLGAVVVPVAMMALQGLQAVASVVFWPAVPAGEGIGSLLSAAGTGAAAGTLAGGGVIGRLAGLMYLSELVSPYQIPGHLEKDGAGLAFKPQGAEHAIDLQAHARAGREPVEAEQWW